MEPLEWLLMAVESAVLIVGLLHIYSDLRKRKESLPIQVRIWYIDTRQDVGKLNERKK